MTREQAIAWHKRVDHEYLVVIRPQPPKATGKQPPLPEQKSARRRPSSGEAPALTQIEEPVTATASAAPTAPLESNHPVSGDPVPIAIVAPEDPSAISKVSPGEPLAAESPSVEVTTPEAPVVPSVKPTTTEAVATGTVDATSGAQSEGIQAQTVVGPAESQMPLSDGASQGSPPTATPVKSTAAVPPQPARLEQSLTRVYLLVVWFIASAGVFAYFLGRFSALGVAWVVGYWMVTVSVAILLWAAGNLMASSPKGQPRPPK